MKSKILRGDVYIANLNPVVGSEQGGIRPVLVIQNDLGNKYSPTVIIAPITSKIESKADLPTHYRLSVNFLDQDSMVLLEQPRTIDKQRLLRYLGHIPQPNINIFARGIKIAFGLIHSEKEKLTYGRRKRLANR